MARVLSCDQATRVSGYAVFDNGEYVESGIVDLSKSTLETPERSFVMAKELWKVIKKYKPDYLILEETQNQNNVKTVQVLSRLQGMIIGYAEAHKVKTYMIQPSKWRKALSYTQGPKIRRDALKQQSLEYVKKNLGLDLSEDAAEAVCLGIAAHQIYNFE